MGNHMSDQPTAKVEVWREIDGAWKIVLMDIPLDVIDESVEDACSNGQCDELALALHSLAARFHIDGYLRRFKGRIAQGM